MNWRFTGTLLGAAFAVVGMLMYDSEPSGASVFFIVHGTLMLHRYMPK